MNRTRSLPARPGRNVAAPWMDADARGAGRARNPLLRASDKTRAFSKMSESVNGAPRQPPLMKGGLARSTGQGGAAR